MAGGGEAEPWEVEPVEFGSMRPDLLFDYNRCVVADMDYGTQGTRELLAKMSHQPDELPIQSDESAVHEIDARKRRARYRIIACGISCGIAFLLFQVARNYLENRPIYLESPDPESGIRLIFDDQLGWRSVPDDESMTFGKKLTTNSRGLRDREYPYAKPTGTKRILVLGDSFTWGYGVADDETFAEVLEQRLQSVEGKWEVINTGVSGWGTDQEYLYLTQEGFDYSPDIVVLALFLGNDFTNNASSKMYKRDKPVFLDLDLQLANVPVPKPADNAPEIKSRAEPLELSAAIVNKMAKECDRHHCQLIVSWFGVYVDPQNVFYLQTAAKFEELLVKSPHVHLLNLDSEFVDMKIELQTLVGNNRRMHWGTDGHKITGEILFRFLKAPGRLE